MKNIVLLIKKEIKDYFISPMAYVVIVAFLILTGGCFAFFKDLYNTGQANMRNTFIFMSQILIIIIPALTMRSWAEEKKSGTIEILMTIPISKFGLIISKFLSALIFTFVTILLTAPIPITLNILGNPDNGIIVAGYLGITLLSASYIAVGQFISINTNNQIISFIVSFLLIGLLYIFGEPFFLQLLPGDIRIYFDALSLSSHFKSIARGVLDTRDILYYSSLIIIVLYFIYKSLKRINKFGK